jgi:hypothetical protein
MASPTSRAVLLIAELQELDRKLMRGQAPSLTLLERQRRAAICRELHAWALERQQGNQAIKRRADPRAAIALRVSVVGGPHSVELITESLAVGGLSVVLTSFLPRVGDLFTLRLQPDAAPDPSLAHSITAMADVVWVDPVRSRAGLRFRQLSEADRAAIEALVLDTLVQSARTLK